MIVQIENYLLIVSGNEEIKNGDWTIDLKTNRIAKCERDSHATPLMKAAIPLSGFKKIIAHLPLNNSPILEGVLLLPELIDNEYDEVCIEVFANCTKDQKFATEHEKHIAEIYFRRGYKAATKMYSEEDLRKAIEYAFNCGKRVELEAVELDFSFEQYVELLIQSLKQPKTPKFFIPEVRQCMYDYIKYCLKPILKTTTNAQRLKVLVGSYEY
jgi:DNA primase